MPLVVRVEPVSIGTVGPVLLMAMEWIRKTQDAAEGRSLSISDSVYIVGVLLDALGYAHGFRVAGCERGIVHRDVSPRNVMLTSRPIA